MYFELGDVVHAFNFQKLFLGKIVHVHFFTFFVFKEFSFFNKNRVQKENMSSLSDSNKHGKKAQNTDEEGGDAGNGGVPTLADVLRIHT